MKKLLTLAALITISLHSNAQEDCRTKVTGTGTTITITNKEKATKYLIERPGYVDVTTCIVAKDSTITLCLPYCMASIKPITNWPCSCTYGPVIIKNDGCNVLPVTYSDFKIQGNSLWITFQRLDNLQMAYVMVNGIVVDSIAPASIKINSPVVKKL
jgi:hypothetical protein